MRKMKLFVILCLVVSSVTYSNIKLDPSKSQNTTIEKAKNGSTIINVNTPNNKGISVNDFENFQTKDGVIFNNSNSRFNMSQIAGMINANPNITGEQARLILNRVGGNNRVEIENYLEVVSKNKTDMIMSSQNGFYLNNTKFINFRNVTFTTAPVNLDSNGNIAPFNIRTGNIEIGRNGIDASGVTQLALLSKQIYIDGPVKGTNMEIVSGEFDYNPDTKTYTKQGTNSNELLISSSAFGSIYGNQIKIVAVNGDVGVKGDVISQYVVAINADGTVKTNNINSGSVTVQAKKYEAEGNIYSSGSVRIKAENSIFLGDYVQSDSYIDIVGNLDNESALMSNDLYVSNRLSNSNFIYNTGILSSESLGNGGTIVNEYRINVKGDVMNNGEIETEYIAGSKFQNYGIIKSENNLIMDVNELHSGNRHSITAKNDLKINSIGYVLTYGGKISAKNILIDASLISYIGEMYAEKKIDLKSRKGYIDNLGKMVGETIVLDSAASAGNYSEMIGHDITFKARQGVNLRSGKLKVHTLRVIAPGFPSLPSDTFPYEIYYEEYN